MKLRKFGWAIAAAALLASAYVPAYADGTKVGFLRCSVSGGVGFIITSAKALNCIFEGNKGTREHYVGTIRRFGLDIGITGPGQLGWAVFAPERGRLRGALAGDYAGLGAEATVGVGAGANALVGGFQRSITLQPLSVSVQIPRAELKRRTTHPAPVPVEPPHRRCAGWKAAWEGSPAAPSG